MYYLLTEVAPYLDEHGCGRDEALLYKRYISEAMCLWGNRVGSWLMDDNMQCDLSRFDSMLEHTDCREFIKILVTCRRLALCNENNKQIKSKYKENALSGINYLHDSSFLKLQRNV